MNFRRLFGISVVTNITTFLLYINAENNFNYIRQNSFILHKSDYKETKQENGTIVYTGLYPRFIIN